MGNSDNKINIGDSWKSLDEMKINIGDSWKDVGEAYVNIGDSWKQFYNNNQNLGNLFIDGEGTINDKTGNHPLTLYGNTAVTTNTYCPYGNSTSSITFDGDGDGISVPNHDDWYFGTGDFTMDYWVRRDASTIGVNKVELSQWDSDLNRWIFWHDGVKWRFYVQIDGVAKIDLIHAVTPLADKWYHIAIVRTGNLFYLFHDGILVKSSEQSFTMPNLSAPLQIGKYSDGSYTQFNIKGYLDNIRIVKGEALWTEDFYVQPIQGNLFIDGEGTVEDETDVHALTWYGGSTVTTSTYCPQGSSSSSITFPGAGYILAPDHVDWTFGNSNFTMDTWIKFNNLGSTGIIMGQWDYSLNTNAATCFYKDGNNCLRFVATDALGVFMMNLVGTTPMTNNVWHHVAVVRYLSGIKLYVNGIEDASSVDVRAINDSNVRFMIGNNWNDPTTPSNYYFNGYMDNIRIIKGTALWRSNFNTSSDKELYY